MHSSVPQGRRAPEYASPGTLERAQHHPDGGIAVSLASRLDLHYLHRAGRFSPDDVRRIWAVTEDPSSTTSAVPITAPAVAHFDSAELAALRDP